MKISVIIPTLNEAEDIVSCLNSVKSQPGKFELLVIDGGSVDGTVEDRAALWEWFRERNGAYPVTGGERMDRKNQSEC